MNARDFAHSLDVANGHTIRTDCPVCGSKKTFTATNNMGSLVWNCYKASCGTGGGTRIRLSAEDIRKSIRNVTDETKAVPLLRPEWLIKDHDAIAEYCHAWQLDAHQIGLLYDVKEARVVFPVHHEGVLVDAAGRALTSRLPKWKRYGKTTLPYSYGTGGVAVVVEDCVSAAAVGNDKYTGVALLGTSLSDGHRSFLSRFSTAIVALDPDALKKTLRIAKELRGHVDNVKVLKLHNDLKYRLEEDFNMLDTLGE